MQNKRSFSVAISGGGIGGLALASTIAKYSADNPITVNVYEAGSEIATTGAGVGLWRRAWQIIQQLGLEAEIIDKAIQPPKESGGLGLVFRKSDEQTGGYDLFEQVLPFGAISLHRADVLGIFQATLPTTGSCSVHTSKRLTKYTQHAPDAPITLHFADGTTATADILIGADGVRSPTRVTMAQLYNAPEPATWADPVFGGSLLYRCLISIELLEKLNASHRAIHQRIIYCGKDKHIVSYPLKGGLINFLAFSSVVGVEEAVERDAWVVDAVPAEIIALFEDWEPDVRELVQCVRQAKRWAVHVVAPLPTFVSGPVALIGDAAHAMPTHMAAGAGQAIEDAYLLGRILTHPSLDPTRLPAALALYDRIRRPFVTHVWEESVAVGLLYEFNAPGYFAGGEAEEGELEKMKHTLEEKWAWHGEAAGGPDDNWAEAKGVLDAGTV